MIVGSVKFKFNITTKEAGLFASEKGVVVMPVKYTYSAGKTTGIASKNKTEGYVKGMFSFYGHYEKVEGEVWDRLWRYWETKVTGLPEDHRPIDIAGAFTKKYHLSEFRHRRDFLNVEYKGKEYQLFVLHLSIDFTFTERFTNWLNELYATDYIDQKLMERYKAAVVYQHDKAGT